MTDPLTWSPINLGRWFGAQVRVHIFLIVFVLFRFLGAALDKTQPFGPSVCWLPLLFLALVVHELGHAGMASWLGCDHDEVRFWPLGNMVTPAVASRSTDQPLVILAGPALNLAVVLLTALGLGLFAQARFVWDPFWGSGAPFVGGVEAKPYTVLWWIGWVG